MKKLDRKFYKKDVLHVAKELVGCFLVREYNSKRIIGRINEVEAYDGDIDKACHAYGNKRTKRTNTLFGEGGIAYVYFIYGMYNCLNVVTGKKDSAAAVLLRGVEIIEGEDLASCNRYGEPLDELTKAQRRNLSNGPGKLCRALHIDRTFDCESLLGDQLYICKEIDTHKKAVTKIEASMRIGIDYAEEAVDFLWRFTG